MKYFKTLVATAAMICSVAASQAAITIDFAALENSDIHFFGGSGGTSGQFNVTTPAPGPAQWVITSDGGLSPTTVGLNGWFTGGPWNYSVDGGGLTGTVTTPGGTFNISDGSATASGNISWITIASIGGLGGLNYNAQVNISGMTYSGSNSSLAALVAASSGSIVLSFQWGSALTLAQLAATGADNSTSYSGTISTVPEPTTMIAGALLLLPFAAATARNLRKRS